MPKFWDELFGKLNPRDQKTLSDVQVIDGSNVAQYIRHKDLDLYHDFPNLAPPFDAFFIECDANLADNGGSDHFRWGVLFESFEMDKPETWDKRSVTAQQLLLRIAESDPDTKAAKWALAAHVYIQKKNAAATLHNAFGMTIEYIDADGQMLRRPNGRILRKIVASNNDFAKTRPSGDYESEINSLLWPCLLTICFLHCKNITVERKEPPRLLTRLAKPNRKPQAFHILRIQPMTRIVDHAARQSNGDYKQALHICRGHFKDFRSKGLFGRHKGLYWWDDQVRGRDADRISTKEYRVEAPEDGAVADQRE